MSPEPAARQFVLLPTRGLRASEPTTSAALGRFFFSIPSGPTPGDAEVLLTPGSPRVPMRVVDSIHEDGAKLVEMTPDAALAVRAEQPGLKLVPVVYYRPAVAPRVSVESRPTAAAGTTAIRIPLKVVSKANGTGVAGAKVVAFLDFANRVGAEGTTDAQGVVRLALGAARTKLERLYVYPEKSFWGALKRNLTMSTGAQIALQPVDLAYTDAVRHFYGNSADNAGAGVTVGVIDTGVDSGHADLRVLGGENTVVGENPSDFGDNGRHHGTHVAGIIAARGTPPAGIRGLAPAVALRSYRVFGQNSERASNYAILKAIDRAVADGCDLINLSLGGPDRDEATLAAIEDARAQGSVVIAAAGNDGRGPVSYPAANSPAVAVSAVGRKGTFPSSSTEAGDVAAPYGHDRKNFIAAFSNVGTEIDLTGPGVGVISTVPGGYAPMSGTSMACPAVTGLAARVLATQASVLAMPRDQARSDAMAQALFQVARSLGFAATFEGHGLPR